MPADGDAAGQKGKGGVDAFFGTYGKEVAIPVPAFHGIEPRLALPKSDFFVDDAAPRTVPQPVAVDVLLLQIEGHVRLEQAAAESFLEAPTAQSLHSRTASPLMN